MGESTVTETNKSAAVGFLKLASSRKVGQADSKFVGDGFRHHNPFFEGSAESLQAGMEENVRQNPDKALEVKRVIAEGEFVATHTRVRQKPGDPSAAVVHIFRLDRGRIVELWDLGQPIPEKSPNKYGMFWQSIRWLQVIKRMLK